MIKRDSSRKTNPEGDVGAVGLNSALLEVKFLSLTVSLPLAAGGVGSGAAQHI